MYSLRPRLTRVNYRTLNGLPGKANMNASAQHSDNSERDTKESPVPSDHDYEESPDKTLEELEALIVQEKTKLAAIKNKAKLLSLKKTVKDFQQETYAEQSKLDRDTGSSKTRSTQNVPKKSKHNEISSRDLREFEDLSQAVEKRLSKMGLDCQDLSNQPGLLDV